MSKKRTVGQAELDQTPISKKRRKLESPNTNNRSMNNQKDKHQKTALEVMINIIDDTQLIKQMKVTRDLVNVIAQYIIRKGICIRWRCRQEFDLLDFQKNKMFTYCPKCINIPCRSCGSFNFISNQQTKQTLKKKWDYASKMVETVHPTFCGVCKTRKEHIFSDGKLFEWYEDARICNSCYVEDHFDNYKYPHKVCYDCFVNGLEICHIHNHYCGIFVHGQEGLVENTNEFGGIKKWDDLYDIVKMVLCGGGCGKYLCKECVADEEIQVGLLKNKENEIKIFCQECVMDKSDESQWELIDWGKIDSIANWKLSLRKILGKDDCKLLRRHMNRKILSK